MAWRWPGYKPLSEPMMVSLLTHICVTQPQWVKGTKPNGRIHRYGASMLGDIIINVSKSINKEKQVFWRLQYIARFDVQSV